jgi:hypothetical protein
VHRLTQSFIGLFALAVLGGCLGIEHSVRGVAVYGNGAACALGDEAGTTISGATVSVLCPDELPLSVTTEMGGRFEISLADRELRPDCEVVVSKPGYRERRYTMEDVCAHAVDGSCRGASVTAYLVVARRSEGGDE